MIYYFDADLHGTDSVNDILATGKVTHIKCATFKDFDEAAIEVAKKATNKDLVVIDTLTQLLETTRMDGKLGTDPSASLWDKRDKYLVGDKNFQTVYQMAQNFVMRGIRNMASADARIITICHEDEVVDFATGQAKSRGPKVNPALVDILIGQSSDVFRMYSVPEDIVNAEGEVTVKADTRVLYLRRSDSFVAKYNVSRSLSAGIPRYILEPTMESLSKVLGKTPTWLTLYGTPGSGKTTLALSEVKTKESK